MIKVTRVSEPRSAVARLRVEGRLIRKTAGELASACRALFAEHAPVVIDLAGVSFIDDHGARTVHLLTSEGATPIGASAFVAAILRTAGGDEGVGAEDRQLLSEEPRAFEDLVRRHGSSMLAFARAACSCEDDARAAVQAACAAALTEVPEAGEDGSPAPWLRALVARHVPIATRSTPPAALDRLLPRFDARGAWASPPAALPAPADVDIAAAVRRCIAALPDELRLVILLRDAANLDDVEAAGRLATTPADVKRRLHLARQALQTLLAAARAAGAREQGAGQDL